MCGSIVKAACSWRGCGARAALLQALGRRKAEWGQHGDGVARERHLKKRLKDVLVEALGICTCRCAYW